MGLEAVAIRFSATLSCVEIAYRSTTAHCDGDVVCLPIKATTKPSVSLDEAFANGIIMVAMVVNVVCYLQAAL